MKKFNIDKSLEEVINDLRKGYKKSLGEPIEPYGIFVGRKHLEFWNNLLKNVKK